MEWYINNNYTNSVNRSIYLDKNFGIRPQAGKYEFNTNSEIFYIDSPDLMSGILNEIFKSSILTLISLFGLTTLKSSPFLNVVQLLVKTLYTLLVALIFYLLLIAFLIPFTIYRLFVHGYYRLFRKNCFLMHGTDAFWCMDNVEARSIINILVFLEISNTNEDLEEILTDQMRKLCSNSTYGLKFLSYRRKSNFGYYYWEKGDLINIKNNVKKINESINTKEDLNVFMDKIVNKEIHGFGWEIYLTNSNMINSKLRPVIFRMHHSIGDGLSIIQALMNSISNEPKLHLNQTIKIPTQTKFSHYKIRNPESEPFIIRIHKIIDLLKVNITAIPSFIFGPMNLIKQLFTNDFVMALSVTKLSGNKIITWINEEKLLNNIKLIRRKTNSKFSEVVFSLFSMSIWKYFERQNIKHPEYINVVVPIFGNNKNFKITSEIVKKEENIKISKISEVSEGMVNGFWVAMLKLPIKMKYSNGSFQNTLRYVKESTGKLCKSPDFIMYKFMLSVIVTLVPDYIVKPMFDVAKTHLVFSNLPGPQKEIKIAGYKVTEMTFWLPNRGTTGLGLSLLSNNNRLSVGLIADTAVIPTHQDLQNILDDFIEQVNLQCV